MIKSNEQHSFLQRYSQANLVQFEAAQQLLKQQMGDSVKEYSMLDVGCGDGRLINSFANSNPSIKRLGIDISEELIKKADKTASTNSQFIAMDARQLDALDDQFELVTSFFCLQWLSTKEFSSVFNTMLNKLKPGAHLVVIMPIDQEALCSARQESLGEYFKHYKIPFGVQSEKDFQTITHPFCTYYKAKIHMDALIHFPLPGGNELFKQYISGWMSELRDCPFTAKSQEEYLNDIVARMPKKANGTINFSTHAYCLHATSSYLCDSKQSK